MEAPEKTKTKKAKRYCVAYGCLNSTIKIPSLSLFALPKDPERRQRWLNLIGREDLIQKENLKSKHYEVCEKHFEDSDIITTILKKLTSNSVVPTKNLITTDSHIANCNQPNTSPTTISLPSNDPSTSKQSPDNQQSLKQRPTTEKSTQTSKALSEKTHRKRRISEKLKISEGKRRKLQFELNKIKTEIDSKHNQMKDPRDEIEGRFKKLVDWQNKLRNKFKGNRYDADYKAFALNLHYSAPQTYRCLQTVLKLPSRSTLCRYKLKIPPKLDDGVLQNLSMKMKSLPDNAKYCTICVDEMVLKRNLYYDIKADEVIGFHNIDGNISPDIASHAYVIMLQGIFVNWKQPIAYAFLASTKHYVELDTWMSAVIKKLCGTGIIVKAVISDQDSNFDKYAKVVKQVTINKPYFFVDGQKIFYIFDVPHLLKCVRNNMLTSDYYLDGKVISWNYIKMLYDDQKDCNLRLIPKLSDAHIDPNKFQVSKRLKYAAQIFSHTVHAALETYIEFGKIPEEAKKTAEFIKKIVSLFDVLNSSKIKTVKKLQSAFRMSDDQKIVLEEAQNIFARIKPINRITGKHNMNHNKTFANFQISIQSIIQLFENLKEEGFKYMFTRSLNQESVENFFVAVSQQGGSCSEPTPVQFSRAFSKLFFVNMLNTSPTAKCETDIYDIFLNAEDVLKTKRIVVPNEAQTSLVNLHGETDYRIDFPEENAVTYVTSYLLFKCTRKHTCENMVNKLHSMQNFNQSTLFTHFKAYNKTSSFYGSLKVPPAEFSQYVGKLEDAFTSNFDKCIQNRPGSTLFELLKDIPPVLLCACFPIDYFLKLFVRLRIYAILKFNNRCFNSGTKSITQHLKVKQL